VEVVYSAKALQGASEIIAYLRFRFSQQQIDAFYERLAQFEKVVVAYPTLYKGSLKVKLRRAVLSEELSVYYSIRGQKIVVVDIQDNRWDSEKRLK